MFELKIVPSAKEDIDFFKKAGSKAALKKIDKLLNELRVHPTTGTGKPKPLTGDLSGHWSRRIDSKNRMLYKILDTIVIVEVLSFRGHYFDK